VVQALSQLEDNPSLAAANAIVLAAADWHPGVVGIAANRLVDQYDKPVVLHCPATRWRGARFGPFGTGLRHSPGHKKPGPPANQLRRPSRRGRAGYPRRKYHAFRQGLSKALADCQIAPEKTLTSMLWLNCRKFSTDLLTTIQRLAPFGPGNPPVRLRLRRAAGDKRDDFWQDRQSQACGGRGQGRAPAGGHLVGWRG